jgi:hypothetical protein
MQVASYLDPTPEIQPVIILERPLFADITIVELQKMRDNKTPISMVHCPPHSPHHRQTRTSAGMLSI